MSASGSATPERDQQLLDIGKQCSASSCLVVDFLPFKCQHCAHAFCRDHFLPADHQCDKYDAARLDRVAPSCPLCNTPVAIPPGQDPNIRMEEHINTRCPVITGRSAKAKSAPTCARPKCDKVLFSPIRCEWCKQQYCPQHRFPKDHVCSSVQTSTTKPASAANAWANVSNQTGAASAATVAAIKRVAASTNASKSPGSRPQAQPSVKPSTSRPNPFSATERPTILVTVPSPTAPAANEPNDDISNDPPQRCSPKLTASSNAPTLSFVPPPLFGMA
ncbi:hypothetical protein BN946_scf184909.g19 [Trametes cinnabarina]|uniref:AN1-type domain-containing protein n=1 Tax=Pycnoporus cinnabarinus TaxID=5643 RepID=A0A060SAP7_PYCCI|nr:hypothetical protein BN946_scf184909.g19 [Trametes cinnabarina]